MNDLQVLTFRDKAYPRTFLSLPHMPERLYCRGDLSLLNQKALAVVGTRSPTKAGRETARWVAEYGVEKGYTIVAGLARGIDMIAHIAAVATGGKTIAVLVDVDRIYPAEHTGLSESIVKSGGLLISEHEPGEEVASFGKELMMRDRLQTALSQAVIPVQSAYKQKNQQGIERLCGTMHTCSWAKKQGRAIFLPEIEKKELEERKETYTGLLHLAAIEKYKWFTFDTMQEIVFDFLEKPLGQF